MKCSIRNIRNIRNNVVFGLRAVAGNDSGCGDSYMDTRVIGVLQSLVTDVIMYSWTVLMQALTPAAHIPAVL